MSNTAKQPKNRVRKAFRLPPALIAAMEAESRKTGLTQTKILEFAILEKLGMRKAK